MLREIAVFIAGVISGAVAAMWVADHMLTRGRAAAVKAASERADLRAQTVTDEIQ
jgi:hypothetical protein